MERINERQLSIHAESLRQAAAQWVEACQADIEEAYSQLPDEIEMLRHYDHRFQDISEPLLVLASLADAERSEGTRYVERLLIGLKAVAHRREPSTQEEQLLAFLRIARALVKNERERFVTSGRLVTIIRDIEELSSITTKKSLAQLLGKFDLFPRQDPTGGTQRGYVLTKEWVDIWAKGINSATCS